MGGGAKSKPVTISNPKGKKKHPGLPVIMEGAPSVGDFTVADSCPAILQPGAKCKLGVTFKPSSLGKISDTLTIENNAVSDPQVVHLVGTGVK